MDYLEKLNRLAKQAGYDDISPPSIIVEPWGDSTSTTIIFDKDQSQAFQLNPIIAVRIKDYIGEPTKVPKDYKGLVAIHRAAISYAMGSRIENVNELKQQLKIIINEGLTDLKNQVGCLIGMKITMKLPDGSYFRHQTDSAGYEIRISVIKE